VATAVIHTKNSTAAFVSAVPVLDGRSRIVKNNHELHPAAEFGVILNAHTVEGARLLCNPDAVRFIIASGIETRGLQEEIDFTVEVTRRYAFGAYRDVFDADGEQ
jgi:hypothetical protein